MVTMPFCERSAFNTGTPAPVISRASVPGGTNRGKVHPQSCSTADGWGICELAVCRKVVFCAHRGHAIACPRPRLRLQVEFGG